MTESFSLLGDIFKVFARGMAEGVKSSGKSVKYSVLKKSCSLFLQVLFGLQKSAKDAAEEEGEAADVRAPPSPIEQDDRLLTIFGEFVDAVFACCFSPDAPVSIFCVNLFLLVLINRPAGDKSSDPTEAIEKIVGRLWEMLDGQYASLEFEVVRSLLKIAKIAPKVVDRVTLQLMTNEGLLGFTKFSRAWRLLDEVRAAAMLTMGGATPRSPSPSRSLPVLPLTLLHSCLFRMLDSLSTKDPVLRMLVTEWLRHTLRNFDRVLSPLLMSMVEFDEFSAMTFLGTKRVAEVMAILNSALDLVTNADLVAVLLSTKTSPHLAKDLHAQPLNYTLDVSVHFGSVAMTLLTLLADKKLPDSSSVKQSAAFLLMRLVVSGWKAPFVRTFCFQVHALVASALADAVKAEDVALQVSLLELMFSILKILSDSAREESSSQAAEEPQVPQRRTRATRTFADYLHMASSSEQLLRSLVLGIRASGAHSYRPLFVRWSERIVGMVSFFDASFERFCSDVLTNYSQILLETAIAGMSLQNGETMLCSLRVIHRLLDYGFATFWKDDDDEEPRSLDLFASLERLFVSKPTPKPVPLTAGERGVQLVISKFPVYAKILVMVWKSLSTPYDAQSVKLQGILGVDHLQDCRGVVSRTRQATLAVASLMLRYQPDLMMESLLQFYTKAHPEMSSSIRVIEQEYDSHIVELMDSVPNSSPKMLFAILLRLISRVQNDKKRKLKNRPADLFCVGFMQTFALNATFGDNYEAFVHLVRLLGFVKENLRINDVFCYGSFLQFVVEFHRRHDLRQDNKKLTGLERDVVHRLIHATLDCVVREIKKHLSSSNDILPDSSPSIQLLELCIEILPSLFEMVFGDVDNRFQVLMTIHQHVCALVRLHRTTPSLIPMMRCIDLIAVLKRYGYLGSRMVRKNLLEYFFDDRIFLIPHRSLKQWSEIMRPLLTEKVLQQLIERVPRRSTPANLFVNKKSDALLRGRLFKRVAFLMYVRGWWGREEALKRLFDQVRYSLQFTDYAKPVVKSVLLCFRMIVRRMQEKEIPVFLSTILYELVRIILRRGIDDEVLFETVKLLDFFYVVKPRVFQRLRWMFFRDPEIGGSQVSSAPPPAVGDADAALFLPYLNQIVETGPDQVAVRAEDYVSPERYDPRAARRPMNLGRFDSTRSRHSLVHAILRLSSLERQKYLQATSGWRGSSFDYQRVEEGSLAEFVELTPEQIAAVSKGLQRESDKKSGKGESWVVVNVAEK